MTSTSGTGHADGDEQASPEAALREAAQALYAGPAAQFVTLRKEWVTRLRQQGLREVAAQVAGLRKPSASAAAINALVAAEHPVVAELVDLGVRLRHAQSALDAAGLTALRGPREQVLTAWVAAASELSGSGALTAAVAAEVRDTGVAALADSSATQVVRSGTLTRALAYSGFGEVDLADAVARTSTGVVLTRIEGGRGQDTEPGEASPGGEESSTSALKISDAEATAPETSDEKATDEQARQARLDALRADLRSAEDAVSTARGRRRSAAARAQEAGTKVQVASAGVAQAEQLLSRAQEHARAAAAEAETAGETLVAAERELTAQRADRDAARAALERAEDD